MGTCGLVEYRFGPVGCSRIQTTDDRYPQRESSLARNVGMNRAIVRVSLHVPRADQVAISQHLVKKGHAHPQFVRLVIVVADDGRERVGTMRDRIVDFPFGYDPAYFELNAVFVRVPTDRHWTQFEM